MRYTKYSYNKKKKNDNEAIKFIVSIIVMAAFAIIVGVSLAKFLSSTILENNKGTELQDEINDDSLQANSGNIEDTNKEDVNTDKDKGLNIVNSNFYTVQCGYFSKEANAKVALEKIDNQYLPFIIKEDNMFRVLTMIGDSTESSKIVEELKKDKIETIKINFMLDSKDEVQNQIAAICDGYLKIIDESLKNDVRFVDTIKFKEWVASLEEFESGKHVDILTNLKIYIKNMPEKIEKETVSEAMIDIYEVLSYFKIK